MVRRVQNALAGLAVFAEGASAVLQPGFDIRPPGAKTIVQPDQLRNRRPTSASDTCISRLPPWVTLRHSAAWMSKAST